MRCLQLLPLLVCLWVREAIAQEPEPERRRLLVIDVDDLGWEFYRANRTPSWKRATAGARTYVHFHAAPLCSPTRSLMQLGAYGSHPDHQLTGLIPEDGSFAMPTDGPLEPLAKVVGQAGFTTAKVGKWHLSSIRDREHPLEAGWQQYVGVMGNPGGDRPYFRWRETRNGRDAGPEEGYLTTAETEHALALVQTGVDLISVSYHAVHDPFHSPPSELLDDLSDSEDPPADPKLRQAIAMFTALGHELERLVSSARQANYAVILFSDNGALALLDGHKGSVTDEGTRVPLWVLGHDVVSGESKALVGAVDLYRTILDYFGVEAGPTRGPDSISFLPTWSGQPGKRKTLFLERFDRNGVDPRTEPERWWRAVRNERYLLLVTPGKQRERMLDLRPRGRWGNLLRGKRTVEEERQYQALRAELFKLTVPRASVAPPSVPVR